MVPSLFSFKVRSVFCQWLIPKNLSPQVVNHKRQRTWHGFLRPIFSSIEKYLRILLSFSLFDFNKEDSLRKNRLNSLSILDKKNQSCQLQSDMYDLETQIFHFWWLLISNRQSLAIKILYDNLNNSMTVAVGQILKIIICYFAHFLS